MIKQWMGTIPKKCEICKQDTGKYFYDMATSMGHWALGCEECFREHGKGTGIGRAQKYVTKTGKGVDGFKEE